MSTVELHDLLLHLLLIRQQLVCPQVVAVCYVIVVTNLSWKTHRPKLTYVKIREPCFVAVCVKF